MDSVKFIIETTIIIYWIGWLTLIIGQNVWAFSGLLIPALKRSSDKYHKEVDAFITGSLIIGAGGTMILGLFFL